MSTANMNYCCVTVHENHRCSPILNVNCHVVRHMREHKSRFFARSLASLIISDQIHTMSLPSETSLGLGRNALIPHRDVFAHFLKSMGLSDNIAIIQRTRIDDDEDILYDMPHPVYAVIVVVPQGTFERSPEVNHWFWFREPGPGEEIKRFEQTIDNARGLYAFFHAFANSPLQQCCGKHPSERFLDIIDQQQIPALRSTFSSRAHMKTNSTFCNRTRGCVNRMLKPFA